MLASCHGSRISTVLVYLDLEKGFPLHLFIKEFQDEGIGTAREVSYKIAKRCGWSLMNRAAFRILWPDLQYIFGHVSLILRPAEG